MSPELIFFPAIYTELQKSKEEEKQMNSVKVSFERQLQNERTLKIQVCLGAYTGLESLEYFLYFHTFTRRLLCHIICCSAAGLC